ncbi:D-glycero-alpha-D-manno-heptose+7-phosphate+kinase [Methylocapsa aurea]
MKVRARAPLRLGFAGGGTDVSPYCDFFGGSVLNATIDRYVYATVADLDHRSVAFDIIEKNIHAEYDLAADRPFDGVLDLHKAVYNRIVTDFLGNQPRAIRLSSMSESPPGSGLGSSSALVVAMVQAMVEFFSIPLGEYEVAQLAYQIERVDLGLAGGKQDQYAAAFGGVNFIEFHQDGTTLVNQLKIKQRVVSELEASLVLYFTGVSRSSADIVKQQMNNVLRKDNDSIDAMHQLKQESVAMKRHLLRGDLQGFARTMQASWQAKKRMAVEISNPLIAHLENVARRAGALACKVSGAGGGGFMFFFVDPDDRIKLVEALASEKGQVSGCHLTTEGASAWRL